MPDAEASMIHILIYSALALILLVLLTTWRILARLGRVEKLLMRLSVAEPEGNDRPSSVESQPGGHFEAFLAEDPARGQLTKSEQFAAYRKWRQEKGLNWTNS